MLFEGDTAELVANKELGPQEIPFDGTQIPVMSLKLEKKVWETFAKMAKLKILQLLDNDKDMS
jgi:hypothetical protein